MKKLNIIKITILIFSLGLIFLFASTWYRTKQVTKIINIHAEQKGFLIVGSKILNIKTTYQVQPETGWKKIFWGHTLVIDANAKVNYGFDTNKIKILPVIEKSCVNIVLPKPQIYNVEVITPILVRSQSGILYKLTKQDDLEDFNNAVDIVKEQAFNAFKDQLPNDTINQFKNMFDKELLSYICDVRIQD